MRLGHVRQVLGGLLTPSPEKPPLQVWFTPPVQTIGPCKIKSWGGCKREAPYDQQRRLLS